MELHAGGKLARGKFFDGAVDGLCQLLRVGTGHFLHGKHNRIGSHKAGVPAPRCAVDFDFGKVFDFYRSRGVRGNERAADLLKRFNAGILLERKFQPGDIFEVAGRLG